jgi:exopolysaccharide biosynthesis protein
VLNIDAQNHARIVHYGDDVQFYNAVAGSAQIVTNGVRTIPVYGEGELTPGGPNNYSNADSWYERVAARTAIGLNRDASELVFLVIERATVSQAADLLIRDYGVWDALNLDGGGSSSLAIEDPVTQEGGLRNSAEGRAVGSNLALIVSISIDNVVLFP